LPWESMAVTACTDSILTGDVGEELNLPLVTFDPVEPEDVDVDVAVDDWVVVAVVVDDVQLVAVVEVVRLELEDGDWMTAGT
jgi:hypothetical protein